MKEKQHHSLRRWTWSGLSGGLLFGVFISVICVMGFIRAETIRALVLCGIAVVGCTTWICYILDRFDSYAWSFARGRYDLLGLYTYRPGAPESIPLPRLQPGLNHLVLFFRNTSPETVIGRIALVTPTGSALVAKVELVEPQSWDWGGTKAYGKATGRHYYPLEIEVSYLPDQPLPDLVFDLQWNFIGTHWERTLPSSREIVVEYGLRG